MRPKNCKTCGGKIMQMGGQPRQQDYPDYESWAAAMDAWSMSNQPSSPQIDLSAYNTPITEENIDRPAPDAVTMNKPKDALEDAINKGIVEAPNGWSSAEEWYTFMNTPKDKRKGPATPSNWARNLGTGMMGLNSLLSEVSGRVARSRQNQYDYFQQSALGMMNPMPTADYQPNPYSLYAKYGGKLKNYQTGGILKGIQQGAKEVLKPRSTVYTSNPNDPRLGAYQDSLNLYKLDQATINAQDATEIAKFNYHLAHPGLNRGKYKGQVDNSYLNDPTIQSMQANVDNASKKLNSYKPISNVENEPVWNGNNSLGFSIDWMNAVGGDIYPSLKQTETAQYVKPVQPIVYKPEPKKLLKKVLPVQDTIPKTDTTKVLRGFKYGGLQHVDYFGPPFSNGATYQFSDAEKYDTTVVTRKIVPQLFHLYPRNNKAKYGTGGIHIKPENKGKFTEYCGGKVTGECIEKGLESPSAIIRKRANFARNARKWN